MIDLEAIQQDRVLLTKILLARRGVTVETLPIGARIAWRIYINILEDALSILNSLIDHLSPRA